MQRYRLSYVLTLGVVALVLVGALAMFSGGGTRAEDTPPLVVMPTILPTPTLAPPPTTGPVLQTETTLFADSFDGSASLSKWQFVDLGAVMPGAETVWNVRNGNLLQDRTAAGGNPDTREVLAVAGKSDWADYTVTAKVHDQNNATFGLVARRQGNSFYRFRWIASEIDTKPKQVLEKVVDGVATPLATADGPGYERRRWYTISMSVSGSQIRVSVDGKVVAEAKDSSLKSGQAGISTIAFGGILFDDVKITAP